MEYSPEQAIELVDEHHAAKLRELAAEYNEANPSTRIAEQYLNDSADIIFSLWARSVTGFIGFGHPYDEIISQWIPNEDKGGNPEYRLDYCLYYVGYRHPELLRHYMVFSGLGSFLPERRALVDVREVNKFNEEWTSFGHPTLRTQEDLIDLSREVPKVHRDSGTLSRWRENKLSDLDWVTMLCLAANYNLIDRGDKLVYIATGHSLH